MDKSDRKLVEEIVDEDLRRFNVWFQEKVGDGPLSQFEKAALKTYLYFKLLGENDAQEGR